jgi:hypothetical protein
MTREWQFDKSTAYEVEKYPEITAHVFAKELLAMLGQ